MSLEGDTQLELSYTDRVPAVGDSVTSTQAAQSVKSHAHTLANRILAYLIAQGQFGATDEELQTQLGIPGNSERPRRCGLERAGFVRDSGRRRPTQSRRMATVWIAITVLGGSDS